jgi:site-specific recombinase XerD
MGASLPKDQRCLKFDKWSAPDREAWRRGTDLSEPSDDPKWAEGVTPDTLETTRKNYERWLGFLASSGILEPDVEPLKRVTRKRLRSYIRQLLACGNLPLTIGSRIDGLRRAFRVIAPDADTLWMRRPFGVTVNVQLGSESRAKTIVDSALLQAEALKLMDQASLTDRAGCLQFRDGLILAFFAACARRLKAMGGLRIGREIVLSGGRYQAQLGPELIKTQKRDWFKFPEELTAYVDTYLQQVRPALATHPLGDCFWVAKHGGQLAKNSLPMRVRHWTERQLGRAIGPHQCRHALITTAAIVASADPYLGPAALGISRPVAERHYNQAGQLHASRTYHAQLRAFMQRRSK